ncbi:pseudouridine synthase [Salinivibrio sp. PR5]|uniref:YqcC family protein n=1 Tax=Salinivibrio sp. PR5 TaxID=1909484 RepID=UPI00098AAEAF|nr:YqcC family protein [Salinivibrio sp. PR5]OOF10854.1 pseudouridine synthase [Salinivibrio sp. PR5]
MSLHFQCIQLLDELEQVLNDHALWQTTPPSAERLASTEPFAVDTLACHEWLQWIFVPKMRALIDAGQTLPRNCEISPYVEEAMKEQAGHREVVAVVVRIDSLFADQ